MKISCRPSLVAALALATLFIPPSVFAVVMAGKHTRSASLDPADPASPQFSAAK